MSNKNETNESVKLDLLDYINDISVFDQKKFMQVPLYILDNLKHNLRGYQKQALQNLDIVENMNGANSIYNQLMFYMATGSGKTDVMAAIILYMYTEFKYQYFLFTVNSSAIINKTRQNLIDNNSFKYLFDNPITIDGNHIKIKEVQTYPNEPENNTIYIRLVSIQTLSNEIYEPYENGLTKEELSKHKTVILADEAHHFNADTKNNNQNKKSKDWEQLLNLIRNLNPKNRQFEFTATINLDDKSILEKYRNKIIFKYDLSNLIKQGYAKKVYKLQANNDTYSKILNAILLSQFRKRIAHSIGINEFKPVILFKSNTIDTSTNTKNKILDIINGLNTEKLRKFIINQYNSTQSDTLSVTYRYWLKQNFAQTVVELKNDFKKETVINVSDSGIKGIMEGNETFDAINTLENPENPVRVVCAVAKLNEGWDVLNLYDIVRINENSTGIGETNSEAQLIGRGARYNPFIFKGKRSYNRRFDNDDLNKQLLERLYYHTINNPIYLDHLEQSFKSINLPVNNDAHITFEAHVKSSFKKTNAFKNGYIYFNKVKKINNIDYDSIKKYDIDVDASHPIDMVDSTLEFKYDINRSIEENRNTSIINVASFSNPNDFALIRTAIQRNKFFRFANLKKYCPTIDSIDEFIHNSNWLGNAIIQAQVSKGISTLSATQKLKTVDRYLIRIKQKIRKNFNRYKGTNNFIPVPINRIVKDYIKRVPLKSNNKTYVYSKDMMNQSWFIYDNAIVDILEGKFIDQIKARIPKIKNKYKSYYLIRIDEKSNDFKLHDFGNDVDKYNGYMPDFILYLQNDDYIYQVYMEPKGEHLLERDNWKQNLLEHISPDNIKVLGENSNVKLYGVKFYIHNDKRHMFKELSQKITLDDN